MRTTDFSGPAAEIARHWGGVRSGTGWLVRCPVPGHGRGRGDLTPSLSIADGTNGRLLVHCFAACAPRDVLAALAGFDNPVDALSRVWSAKVAKPAKVDAAARSDYARAIWQQALRG